MSYKIIEKNEYGVLVENETDENDCVLCIYYDSDIVGVCNLCHDNSYFLSDFEAKILELKNDLKAKIEELESRIKEMEKTIENNVTELIHRTGDLTHDFWYFCAECLENFEMDHGFNYCPNCGRKILR